MYLNGRSAVYGTTRSLYCIDTLSIDLSTRSIGTFLLFIIELDNGEQLNSDTGKKTNGALLRVTSISSIMMLLIASFVIKRR